MLGSCTLKDAPVLLFVREEEEGRRSSVELVAIYGLRLLGLGL